MARTERKVIASLCETKDIQPLLGGKSVDDLFVDYAEVWEFIKSYYYKYRSVPDQDVVAAKFDFFDPMEVKGETEYHLDNLRDEYLKYSLGQLTLKLKDKSQRLAPSVVMTGALAELMRLQDISVDSQDIDITDTGAAVEDYAQTRQLAELMGGTPGIPTGLSIIDSSYTSGLVGGDFVLILGYTGRGKSILSTLISINAFDLGFKPMIVSLEMSAKKVRDRAYTMMGNGRFSNTDLLNGQINEDDFKSWSATVKKDRGFVVVSHNGGEEVTPIVIQSKIDQHKPDLVIVDYAQLMSDNEGSESMVNRMRNLSMQFKRLAMSNQIPIILIASATPESASAANVAPRIENVAWSRQLSYDVDLGIAVHRHDGKLDDGSVIIELVGDKNRNGDKFAGFLKANIDRGVYEEFFNIEDIR